MLLIIIHFSYTNVEKKDNFWRNNIVGKTCIFIEKSEIILIVPGLKDLNEEPVIMFHWVTLPFSILNAVEYPPNTPTEEITGLKIHTPFIIANNSVNVNVSWHFSFTGQLCWKLFSKQVKRDFWDVRVCYVALNAAYHGLQLLRMLGMLSFSSSTSQFISN